MDKLKALVVDDKRIVGDMFDFFLGLHGHQVVFVDNPQEALDKVRGESFDIAFCDIVMPQKDGISLLQEIKTVSPHLPVIMISGFTVPEQRRRAHELGAVTCLDKPFAREDLRAAVKLATGIEI